MPLWHTLCLCAPSFVLLSDCQLIMPLIYQLLVGPMASPSFTAWRIAFFIPAFCQLVAGLGVLVLGQDDPDGQYLDLHKKGERKMDQPWKVRPHGVPLQSHTPTA